MSKTIKIIELFNYIARVERVPKHIKLLSGEHETFTFDEDEGKYYNDNENKASLLDYISRYNAYIWFNLSVEILEDEEKIKTLNPDEEYFKDGTELIYELMYDKINELIFKVNKHEKQIKKLEDKQC